jgi:hypothetical protein
VAHPATIWPAAVSERSRAMVSGPPRSARVVAQFPTALYLVVEADGHGQPQPAVLPVVARGGLRLPTAVTLATDVPGGDWGAGVGSRVVVGDGAIRLPGAEVAGVRTWRPRRMPSLVRTPGVAASAVLDRPHGPLREQARDIVEDLCARRDVTARVNAHVGAGQGLTPSGDDALCGVLLGLRLMGARTTALAVVLWEAVRGRLAVTTSLSASMLAEAAEGYAVPPVIHLGEALVEATAADAAEGTVERVAARAADVAAVGHTSGTDLLAGVAGCLDVLVAPADHPWGAARHDTVDLVRSIP